ncbi:hypothetical protein BKA70DRAFT_1201112 [Coprinopsis sp. MPI-PUGE-AT-0042]|nr:hypothetical protein BKA70DRAFT_1201112 [Coprinopsis sp. MPI-PUGE-AT-0042]
MDTPSARSNTGVPPPLSAGTFSRALEADPNHGQCLVENSRNQRIYPTHVLRRSRSALSQMMDSLEWCWNMRRNTLNLDSRENICFLGASLYLLYKNCQWGLLPSESIVEQFFGARGAFVLPRVKFPDIQGPTFEYTLFPFSNMQRVQITQHEDDSSPPSIHSYPFTDLPTLTSHIHPRFAIMGFALNLLSLELPDHHMCAIYNTWPITRKIVALYNAWTADIPDYAQYDPSYITTPPPASPPLDNDNDDTESVCTRCRRVPYQPFDPYPNPRPSRVPLQLAAKRSSHPNNRYEPFDPRPPHRRRRDEKPGVLDSNAHMAQATPLESSPMWTKEAISYWARHCARACDE